MQASQHKGCKLSKSACFNSAENPRKTHNSLRQSTSSIPDSTVEEEVILPAEVSYKRALEEAKTELEFSKKKIKTLQQTKRRYKKRIGNLKNVIEILKKERFIDVDTAKIIGASSVHVQDIFSRLVAKHAGNSNPRKFSPELRAFALTLHFYSVKAYNFVRKTFDLCLPHPRTLTKWYEHIDGKPGFTSESFSTVSEKIKESPHELLFCLTFDEMAIREHTEFDGKTYHGYINMGVELNETASCLNMPEAKESFVFLLTCINASWKIPLGYFFVVSLSSEQKSQLVNQCLSLLHQINAKVICVTFDGLKANLTTAELLGCNFDPDNLKANFTHPNEKENIAVFLDPSHMLKLLRNCLGDKKSFVDSNNNLIDWGYITELHKLQEAEGLHLGNKLRRAHISYFTKKMKVSLAAQVFSKSVADALQFASEQLKLPQFSGCEPTIKFIRIINDLFDILNSHNTKQYGWKKAISKHNCEDTIQKLEEIKQYIYGLKESKNGKAMVNSLRKTGFLGFLVCIESTKSMIELYVKAEGSPIVYLPTYKLSQDHIELLFAKIRILGMCNNNPTARQFTSAYKKLLVKSQLTDSVTGNCLPLTAVSVLHVSSNNSKNIINMTSNTEEDEEKNVLTAKDPVFPSDEDYMFSPTALTVCSEHIVYYIAGFVSRKLSTKLKCSDCTEVLYSEEIKPNSLTCYKSNGHLIYPSDDVFIICKKSESWFRKEIKFCERNASIPNIQKTSSFVLKSLMSANLFLNLKNHMYDTEPMDNHYLHLLKSVIYEYLKVRFHYFCKNNTKKENSVRQLYNKIVLFKGQ